MLDREKCEAVRRERDIDGILKVVCRNTPTLQKTRGIYIRKTKTESLLGRRKVGGTGGRRVVVRGTRKGVRTGGPHGV